MLRLHHKMKSVKISGQFTKWHKRKKAKSKVFRNIRHTWMYETKGKQVSVYNNRKDTRKHPKNTANLIYRWIKKEKVFSVKILFLMYNIHLLNLNYTKNIALKNTDRSKIYIVP